MLSYHNFCLQDGEKIRSYTYDSDVRICGYSISNLYSWNNVYKTQWAEYKGFLVVRYWYNGELIYFYPLGKGDIREVIDQIREEAVSQEFGLKIIGPMEIMKRDLSEFCSINFNFTSNRDSFEYVYLRSTLASLSGKKLQPKRNHINKFKSEYPDYRFEILSRDNVKDCYKIEEKWAFEHGNEKESVLVERDVINRALENIESLDVRGGVLYVGDDPVAFTFGCAINKDTFGVQVEKANTEYQGAYPMINQEFVKSLPEEFIYINREEDLGEENLRKAKLSYYPQMLIEVGYASWSQPIESKQIKKTLKNDWMRVFDISEKTVDLYLKLRYSQDNTIYLSDGDKLLCSTQLTHFYLNYAGDNIPMVYMSYLYTLEEFKGRGYMSELFNNTFNELQKQNIPLIFLITYEEKLRKIYNRRGFENILNYAFKKEDMAESVSDLELDNYKTYYIEEYDGDVYSYLNSYLKSSDYTLQIPPCYFNYMIEDMLISGDSCIVVRKDAVVSGLSIVYYSDGNAYIHLLSFEDEKSRVLLYDAIQNKYSPKNIYRYERVDELKTKEEGWKIGNMAMARIINIDAFLDVFARKNPLESFVYRVTDDIITQNNGIFVVEKGKYKRLEEYDLPVDSITINEFITKFLNSVNIYTPLMMETVLPE